MYMVNSNEIKDRCYFHKKFESKFEELLINNKVVEKEIEFLKESLMQLKTNMNETNQNVKDFKSALTKFTLSIIGAIVVMTLKYVIESV